MKNIILLLFITLGIICFINQKNTNSNLSNENNHVLDVDNQKNVRGNAIPNHFILGGEQLPLDVTKAWTDTLKNIGMNTVVITVKAQQGAWDSDDLFFETEDTTAILERIRIAKKNNLNVFLSPQIQLDESNTTNQLDGIWGGKVLPKNDQMIASWFEKYGDFLLFWTNIAAVEGVEMMSIGNGLKALTTASMEMEETPFLSVGNPQKARQKNQAGFVDDLFEKNKLKIIKKATQSSPLDPQQKRQLLLTEEWLQLIDNVREIYKGKLIYTAHHDNYRNIEFWSALDFVGINAHFSLSDKELKKVELPVFYEELKNNWQAIFDDLNDFKDTHSLNEKKILFTDVAYSCYEKSTKMTWQNYEQWKLDSTLPQREDTLALAYNERMLAVDALVEVKDKNPQILLKGVLYNSLTINSSTALSYPLSLQIGKASTDHLQHEFLKFLE